jgi:hypothetical protein
MSMSNWLERAKREILKSYDMGTANTAERTLTSVTAVAEPEFPPKAWVAEEIRHGGMLKAVKICSAVLEDHLWLILDRSFEPKDGLAIYFPEELATIATKSPEELREIHSIKLKFPGCRIIQEGAED